MTNKYLWDSLKEKNPQLCESNWKYYFSSAFPMSHIYKKKIIKKTIPKQFIHVTPNLNIILNENTIFGSTGGCLGPGVYVSPLSREKSLSSVSSHIIIKRFNFDRDPPKKVFLIAMYPSRSHNKFLGVDYLKNGEKYYEFAAKYNKSLFSNGIEEIEANLPKAISGLNFLYRYNFENEKITEYQKVLKKLLSFSSIFSYILYETLQEFICLSQNDYRAVNNPSKEELYYWNFKDIILEIEPKLRTNFKLANFCPSLINIARVLENKSKKKECFLSFDKKFFLDFFKYRFAQNLRYKVSGINMALERDLSISEIINLRGLIGHVIHRKYKDLYLGTETLFKYELYRQNSILKIYDREQIIATYNKIIPIGEYCINPHARNYRVYIGTVDLQSLKLSKVEKTNIVLNTHRNVRNIISTFRPL